MKWTLFEDILPTLRIVCDQLGYVVETVVRGLEPDASPRSLDEVVLDVRPLVGWETDADRHRIGLTWLPDHEILEK